MDKHEIHCAAEALGFKGDRYGHLKSPKGQYRLKFQQTSLRVERKYPDGWFNIASDYYSNIKADEQGRIYVKHCRLVPVH
jgi:hypothetical protein